MFPCSKVFHLNGKPTFNVPEGKQIDIGRQLEKIVKAQRFTFKETCLLPPVRTNGDRNFEYRILQTLDPHGEHYAICFSYFEADNTLEIYSEIPAERVLPIATYIVENYLNVHLGETISTSYHHIDTTVKRNPIEELVAGTRDHPLNVRLVDVDPSAGKSLRAALKDPGGRPPKTHGSAKVMTQAEMAIAFGSPCNENMVNGWEARAAGKKRGANPPNTLYNGERIIYSAELRLNPTPDNQKRLTALISEFQSRHRIKEAIGEKARHFKSPETLAKASGQVASAIRERNQLKYEK